MYQGFCVRARGTSEFATMRPFPVRRKELVLAGQRLRRGAGHRKPGPGARFELRPWLERTTLLRCGIQRGQPYCSTVSSVSAHAGGAPWGRPRLPRQRRRIRCDERFSGAETLARAFRERRPCPLSGLPWRTASETVGARRSPLPTGTLRRHGSRLPSPSSLMAARSRR